METSLAKKTCSPQETAKRISLCPGVTLKKHRSDIVRGITLQTLLTINWVYV